MLGTTLVGVSTAVEDCDEVEVEEAEAEEVEEVFRAMTGDLKALKLLSEPKRPPTMVLPPLVCGVGG